jgi:prepilin-type N-terminal cleavage/methylation domain-containing protein
MKRPLGNRSGFTLLEVILALLLLGVSLLMLVEQSAESTRRDTDRAARLVAHRTLRNEVQRLRASDPLAAPAEGGAFPVTYLTDRAGNRAATAGPGVQVVTVSREVACLGGSVLQDNASQPTPSLGCGAGSAPVALFTVRVVFPSRYATDGEDAVEQTITLWPHDRHGEGWSPAG